MSKNNVYRVFFLIICLFAISASSLSQTSYPIVTENGKSYYIYTAQPSEGFFAIAKKFGVTQEEIKAVNPGLDSGLKVGQEIRVPVKNAQPLTHTVAPGETLYSIATRYASTVGELKKLNPEAENGIKVGQQIILPQKNKITVAAPQTTTPVSSTATTASTSANIHTVASGETLYSIATRYGVSVKEISDLNPGAENGVKVGQKLTIPAKSAATITTQTTQNTTNNRTYIITSGDTLYSLAKSSGTTVDELTRLNPGVENGLKVGSAITLPEREDLYIYHTIKEGETLYSISRQYELSQEQIIASNPGLSISTLATGKVVRLDTEKIRKNKLEREQREAAAKSTFTYVAEGKEKIEDVANKFNVTVEDLKKINKKVPKKMSKGDKIEIPSPKVTVAIKTEAPVPEPINLSNTTPQIAIMLPFMANVKGKKAESDRMVEYYEGFLLALNEAKQKGFSADVYVYEIKNREDINKVLGNPKMKEMNLIIGPAYDENVDLLSDFSKAYSIPLVIPFTSKNDSYQNNPYIYQINSPQNYFYSKAVTVFAREYKNANVIILSVDGISNDKADFTNTLAKQLEQQGVSYYNVKITTGNADALESKLSSDKKNVIIPAFSSSANLERVLPLVLKLKQKNESKEMILFGYPEWQTYSRNIRNTFFHPLNTYIFSPFYASMSALETNRIRTDYMKAYSKDIIPTFPKFALLGYDTGKYFMTALQKFGYKFQDNLHTYIYSGAQMNFNFERITYWSGFINRNIYFVHFEPDSDSVTASSYR